MKILGISASPRGKGNSYYLLRKALDEAHRAVPEAEIDIFHFGSKKFSGCVHCNGCLEKGTCVIQDDFQELASLWMAADAIIYSVPVYHFYIPGQLKCFLDRLGNSHLPEIHRQALEKGFAKCLKVVGIISQGAAIFSGQEHSVTELINHAILMGCIPIAGNMSESYIGACGWTEWSVNKDAMEKLEAMPSSATKVSMKAVETLGYNVAYLTRLIKAGRESLMKENA